MPPGLRNQSARGESIFHGASHALLRCKLLSLLKHAQSVRRHEG